MERHKINEDQGFTMLIHAWQRTNTKLRDVAAELVQTVRCPLNIDDCPAEKPAGQESVSRQCRITRLRLKLHD
jgi:ANTAR domain